MAVRMNARTVHAPSIASLRQSPARAKPLPAFGVVAAERRVRGIPPRTRRISAVHEKGRGFHERHKLSVCVPPRSIAAPNLNRNRVNRLLSKVFADQGGGGANQSEAQMINAGLDAVRDQSTQDVKRPPISTCSFSVRRGTLPKNPTQIVQHLTLRLRTPTGCTILWPSAPVGPLLSLLSTHHTPRSYPAP